MARKLEDIFNECYERMRSGESLESCLYRYPEHAAELEQLLMTAFDIGRRASYIQPRPEFKHWSLVRLEGERHYISQQRQPAKPGHFSWRQGWAVAIASVLILLLTGVGTAAASSNALPDEPLYPVKLATEQVRLTLAVTDAQKAQVHIQLVETRAVEVEVMANEGKTEHAAITAARLAKQLELANAAIDKLEATSGTTPPPATTETVTEEQPTTPEEPEATETVTGEQPTTPEEPEATETVTGEQPTTPEEPEATETVTGEQPPAEEQPATPPETVTEEQPTPADVPPAPPETMVTEEQPTPAEEPTTPSEATKPDKWSTQRERFKKSLEESTSKSLTALENAKGKASQQAKPDWQRAIDTIDKSKERQSHKDGTQDWGDWNKNNNQPAPVWPGQPPTQNDNKTRNGWWPK
jgi:hypothetical protein